MRKHDHKQAPQPAAILRRSLKTAFPKVPFRVLTQKYGNRLSLNVRWTDGPKVEEVAHAFNPKAVKVPVGLSRTYSDEAIQAALKAVCKAAHRRCLWTAADFHAGKLKEVWLEAGTWDLQHLVWVKLNGKKL